MKTMKAAVIGCGGIASDTHIPNCFAIPGLELAALCERDPAKLEATARTFGTAAENTYTDVDELCGRQDIDAFLICTPAATHSKIALKAAEARKHVFVEKPIAHTVDDARAMVKAFGTAGLKLAVGHYLQFMPHHIHVKESIRSGNIGQVISATVHDEIITIKPAEGIILDLSTHYVDLLRWYFDDTKVESVFATCRKMSADESHLETTAEIKMFFASGVIGNVNLYWVPAFRNRDGCSKDLSIVGTHGKYKTPFTTSSVEVYRVNNFLSRLRGPYEFVPKFVAHPEMPISATSFRRELEDFTRSVLDDRAPAVPGEVGVEVMQVLAAAFRSIAEGRTVRMSEV